jgi:beta-phosphoglucomutase
MESELLSSGPVRGREARGGEAEAEDLCGDARSVRNADGRYDSILFDFDGVLADTEPVHWTCWAEIVRPLGIDLDWETYRRIGIGATDRVLCEAIADLAEPGVLTQEVLDKYPAKCKLFLDKSRTIRPVSKTTIRLVASLEDYGLAVVTSSFASEVEPLLEQAGIRQYFGALVAAADVQHHKPAPDPYLLAAELLHAKHPLVIEDSSAGVASARAAGFDVVKLATPAELAEVLRAALSAATHVGARIEPIE